ncbi:MAG TPA: hypothetical protein VFV81_04380 [Verrucomicrobiae bacterium]|nr:hypothetical protein [Verrucomicrobiae bacterium]
MKKFILGGLAAVLIVGIAAAAFWFTRPQMIRAKNGATITLIGVSYGKHHVPPRIKLAHARARRAGSAIDTTNDTLVIWIETESKSANWPNYNVMVYDPAETACVAAAQRSGDQVTKGVFVQGYVLDAYPRRDRKMIVRLAAWNNMGRMQEVKGEFVIANPGPRSFSDWSPETIPDTQSDGDLDVTLTRCQYGVAGFNRGLGSVKDPMNKAVAVAFRFQQNGKPVNNWEPVGIITSDATGNSVANNSWSNTHDQNGDPMMTYQWALWPAESAWKLHVEFSRTGGFKDSDLWTVANVPVNEGKQMEFWNYGYNHQLSAPFAETTLNGIHLKLYPAMRFTDQSYNGEKTGGFRIIADPAPEGYRMTLVSAIDENGHKIPTWNPSWGGGNYGFQLQDLRNAKFLNLTVALHKSRFADFTVKPAKP